MPPITWSWQMNFIRSQLFLPELESELRKVAVESKALLRKRYTKLFDRVPPAAFGPDLLRRAVAHGMQEDVLGGLSKASQRELNRLVTAFMTNPTGALKHSRRAQSGTVLVREWKGVSHRVVVVDQGFYYGDRTYTSLSEVARSITGTRWNGPRFFGLRRNKQDASAAPHPDSRLPSGHRTPSPIKSAVRVVHGF